MKIRKIGRFDVSEISLGCINLSHAYGVPPSLADAERLLLTALDRGITHFDTAALYGLGGNEELVGRVLVPHRQRFMLASKCGITGVDGKRVIDGRPSTLKKTCEESLRRLRTDRIDLYYLHRWDMSIPVEESVGALGELVAEGKVQTIGLSEVSAATLRRAHAAHPITAVQSEYSLWARNAELGVLAACKDIGAAFVAFSPVGRGYLADAIKSPDEFVANDIRRNFPRFQEPHFSKNAKLLTEFRHLSREAGCTPAQLAIAWLLNRGPGIIPLPGTRSIAHLDENLGAASVTITAEIAKRAEEIFDTTRISGPRYPASLQAQISTEEYPSSSS